LGGDAALPRSLFRRNLGGDVGTTEVVPWLHTRKNNCRSFGRHGDLRMTALRKLFEARASGRAPSSSGISKRMQVGTPPRRLVRTLFALLVLALAMQVCVAAQPPTDSFRWVDFHSAQDQSIVVWVTRSLEVEKWTAVREIGVLYDAALVVTSDRASAEAPPSADTFTIWNASLTSHVIAPLLSGVDLRWFDWEHFVDGDPGELTALYENCHECAASTFFAAFHYDLTHHMWTVRWLRGGQGVLVWNAVPQSSAGVSWAQVFAVMGGADGRALLATWTHIDYGKQKYPANTVFRYDVDPMTGMDRTVELTGQDAQAMELRLCKGQDTVQGLERGQDSALCTELLGKQPQRKPVTTPPANNRGQSAPPRH
jgi:hypothetical protein